jgi:centrosomal protein CEP192
MIATFVCYPLFGSFQKIVKVQIREDLTQEDLLPHLASNTFGILTPAPELSVGHLTKPVTKPPSTKVEIRSKMITFPVTQPGKTSGIVS